MNSVLDMPVPETAHCGVCKNRLEFSTDGAGRTIERCSNPRCCNRQPHRPQPDELGPARRTRGGTKRLPSDSYTR